MKLTLRKLKKLDDEDLFETIHGYADSKIQENPYNEVRIVSGLPDGFSAIYSTWLADVEICNGGFNQFFWNHGEDYGEVAADGYQLMGLEEHAVLMKRAIYIWKKEDIRYLQSTDPGRSSKISECKRTHRCGHSARQIAYVTRRKSIEVAATCFCVTAGQYNRDTNCTQHAEIVTKAVQTSLA